MSFELEERPEVVVDADPGEIVLVAPSKQAAGFDVIAQPMPIMPILRSSFPVSFNWNGFDEASFGVG